MMSNLDLVPPVVDLNEPYSGESWVGFVPPPDVRKKMRDAKQREREYIVRAVSSLG